MGELSTSKVVSIMEAFLNLFGQILILVSILSCNGEITPCKDSVESKVCFLVTTKDGYVPTKNPEPLPTLINVTVNINDILDVNEEKKFVTLSMRITVEWYDFKLDVKRSNEEAKM